MSDSCSGELKTHVTKYYGCALKDRKPGFNQSDRLSRALINLSRHLDSYSGSAASSDVFCRDVTENVKNN